MKLRTIRGGYVVSLSNEEEELVKKIEKDGSSRVGSLNEREQELANKLTSRGILVRGNKNNKQYYRFNDLEDTWRD